MIFCASLAFNPIFVLEVIKIYHRFYIFDDAFMLVHTFNDLSVVEFKFVFEFKPCLN